MNIKIVERKKCLYKTVHLLKAQQAYDTLKEARKNSHDEDSDTLVTAVDLQQALPTPHLATETVFYLCQLWTYNFGIHFLNSETATVCVCVYVARVYSRKRIR
jgi:hypothetical protein